MLGHESLRPVADKVPRGAPDAHAARLRHHLLSRLVLVCELGCPPLRDCIGRKDLYDLPGKRYSKVGVVFGVEMNSIHTIG